jgi:type I restriction enzyme S subunit
MISRSSVTGAFPTKRLGDVAEFLDGMRRPVTESDRRPGPYPYYGANGQQGTIDDFIFDEPLVLLAEDGGHFEDPGRGIAYRISGRSWVNNHAHVLRPTKEMDLRFLCRVLENYDATPWVTGTTRGKLTQAGAAQIVVPVPPLPEQRRIADILEKADVLRAKRRAALAQLDILTQFIFLDMFGDPATNPKGWSVVPLGDLMTEVYRYPTYYDITYVGDGVPEIRGELLNEDGTVITDAAALRYISAETSKRFPRTVLAEGDLVMSVRGTIGKVAVVPAILHGANMTANLLRLAPNREQVHPIYLWHYMQTIWFRAQLANACSSTTIQTIKAPDLKRIGVMRPPIDRQRDFNQTANATRDQKTVMLTGMAGLDSLFASIQYSAFRGAL